MDEDSSADAFFGDLIHAVEQQLDSPATAYVRRVYERLVGAGSEPEEAKELIAGCLAEETDVMYRKQRPFDEKAYRARLDAL